MGGRGGSSGMGSVPYDKWGPEIHEEIRDSNGNVIGYIDDEIRYDMVPDIRPTTKKEVLSDIDNWRMDDGTYGDEDTKIYFSYDNGDVIDAEELNGKKYKKKGLIGAYIGTGDYEMAWGDELVWNKETRQRERVPIQTWSIDDESGVSNSYSGYKAVGAHRVRVKTTYNNPDGRGGYRVRREIIRQSTVKKL